MQFSVNLHPTGGLRPLVIVEKWITPCSALYKLQVNGIQRIFYDELKYSTTVGVCSARRPSSCSAYDSRSIQALSNTRQHPWEMTSLSHPDAQRWSQGPPRISSHPRSRDVLFFKEDFLWHRWMETSHTVQIHAYSLYITYKGYVVWLIYPL